MAITMKVIGLEELSKKLDLEYLAEPVKRRVFREAAEEARDYLGQLVPRRTGASAATMDLSIQDAGYKIEDSGARLAITADPLKYLEFGTKVGSTKSLIRARGQYRIRTSGGSQRIKRRRFMAKTIGRTRANIRKLAEAAARDVEARWSA